MQPHDTTRHKICTKCGQEKPIAEFSKNKTTRDGLQQQCKACNRAHREANKARISEQRRAFRESNKERLNEIARVYREVHIERIREYDRNRRNSTEEKAAKAEYDRAYRERRGEELLAKTRDRLRKNKAKYTLARRRYYRKNAEQIYGRVRAWIVANPEKAKAQSQRRRARKINAEGTHTGADIQAQYERQKRKCYWCGEKLSDTYHVDHIVPLSRGGTNWPENLVIACPSCNCSKQDKLPHEWVGSGRLL